LKLGYSSSETVGAKGLCFASLDFYSKNDPLQ
jgi:hypothetical protein